MNSFPVKSSPELCHPSTSVEQYDDSALEGVAANVKLLLKVIQDHKDACNKEKTDSRRMLRVAGMMTILDNVRNRIQKCQSFGNKNSSGSELRRCNTDLKAKDVPKDKKIGNEPIADEKERLKKQINASLAARKNLEIMCSSLGKEKEIMAAELARKNYELSGLEEHINDLKAQNATLLDKVKEFAEEHEEKNVGAGEKREAQDNAALKDQNKELSAQLLRSLDGYRYMKRKLRDAQEENLQMHEIMEEISEKVEVGIHRIRVLKEKIDKESDKIVDFEEGTLEVENVFQCLKMIVSKHGQRKE